MNQAKEKLWSSDFIILMAACSGISFCNYFFSSTLPIYAKNLTGTTVYAGLIMTVYTLSALATRPVTGFLCDKFGRVKLLVLGAFLCAVACFLYNFASIIILLILFRMLHGIGFGIHSTCGGAAASDIIPKPRLSEGLGYFSLYGTIASAVAPAIALTIIGNGRIENFRALFILSAAITLVSMVLDCFIQYERRNKAEPPDKNTVKAKTSGSKESLPKTILGFEYGVFLPSAVIILVFIAFSSIMSFLPLFSLDRNFGNVGLFFTINSIGLFLSRLTIGKVADRRGEDIVVIPSILAAGIGLGLIPLAQTAVYLYLLALPLGFAQGAIFPAMNMMMIKRCSPQKRGTAAAAFFSSIDIGIGAGSMIHAYVADIFNYSFIYWGAMLFCGMALMVYIFLVMPSNRKRGNM
jgi:MFS family permease